ETPGVTDSKCDDEWLLEVFELLFIVEVAADSPAERFESGNINGNGNKLAIEKVSLRSPRNPSCTLKNLMYVQDMSHPYITNKNCDCVSNMRK
ncbi:7288_t:CDS:2, partial [Racocetra fulgida]